MILSGSEIQSLWQPQCENEHCAFPHWIIQKYNTLCAGGSSRPYGSSERKIYYDVKDDTQYEKVELLRLMGVEPIDFGIERPDRDNPQSAQVYQEFYRKAIDDIHMKMRG